MVRSCCAYNCTARDVTREAGIKFYRIPQNEAKRRLWLNAINRKDFHPTPDTGICSQHFVRDVVVTALYTRVCLAAVWKRNASGWQMLTIKTWIDPFTCEQVPLPIEGLSTKRKACKVTY